MIKKMLLLAGMAMALVAFAAPAVAQGGAYWTHTDEEGNVVTVGFGSGNGITIYALSQITSSYAGLNTRALISLEGEVWNDGNSQMGDGLIFHKSVTGTGEIVGIPTAICTVTVTLNKGNWSLTLTTDPLSAATTDATLDMDNFTIRYIYSHGCQTAAPVPPVAQATGTATFTAESVPDYRHVSLTFELTQNIYPYNAAGEHITGGGHVSLSSLPIMFGPSGEGSLGVEQHP